MYRIFILSFLCTPSSFGSLLEKAIFKGVDDTCSSVKHLLGAEVSQLERDNREPEVDKEMSINYESSDGKIQNFSMNEAPTKIPKADFFDPEQLTYIFMHGYLSNGKTDAAFESDIFEPIKNSLFKIGKSNVLTVGSGNLIDAKKNYDEVTSNVYFIGERLGKMLAELSQNGIKSSYIHLIGHSLGAHIMGIAGKTYTSITGKMVGRVTGLDPAGPCFLHASENKKLQPTDADFVDVIHASAGKHGINETDGQVNFLPNGGSHQVGCISDSCNHERAIKYFSESIVDKTAFPAVSCDSYDDFKLRNCGQKINYMGFYAEKGSKNYFLLTAKKAPFGLGIAGTVYKDWKTNLRDQFQSFLNLFKKCGKQK